MRDKLLRLRPNNPPVVDDLLAALELRPMPESTPAYRWDDWVFSMVDDGLLPDRGAIYADFLTCEC